MKQTKQSHSLCGGEKRNRRNQHAVNRVCSQVEKIVGVTLQSDFENPNLNQLYVSRVLAHPDVSCLLVVLARTTGEPFSLDECATILADLDRVRPMLRASVAEELNRKRAPDLSFTLELPGAEFDGGYDDELV